MSDIFKKFKSVFIVDNEGTETTASPQTQQTSAASTPVQAPVNTPAPVSGSVSNKFVDILSAALEKNNQDGFDYFEFRQSLKNLAKMPMDEATRFQSAFAMAQTMGVTSDKLVESAGFYLGILDNEQSKFGEAHLQQRAKLIGNREEEIKTLDDTIVQKAEQIKQLTQQIEEHRLRVEQIRKEVSESTIKIETTKADFEATFTNVKANIQADLEKIKQYLK